MPTPERTPQRVLHLSDLHIAETDDSRRILGHLPGALSKYLKANPDPALASIFITGDVFDTSDYERTTAMARFTELYTALMAALPAPVPVVLLPGNHDRRKFGVMRDNDPSLFRHLGDATQAMNPPVLRQQIRAEVVPPANHRLGAEVATYDSTVLLKGKFSAGGELRQDDLLWLLASLSRSPRPEAPLVLLTHHHLIPTPLTDVGRVDVHGRGTVERVLIEKVLPYLVSNADHEELTMTALGAGSALTTLHGVGRPVVVLHGHKHYPAARLVVGTEAGENDVLVLSAGSAGVAEPWSPTGRRDPEADIGHLWPSFNVIEFGADDSLAARTIPFSPYSGRLAPARLLIDVLRNGGRWELNKPAAQPDFIREVASNRVHFTLSDAGTRWHLRGTRVLAPLGDREVAYVEVVEGAPGARATEIDDGAEEPHGDKVPFHLAVSTDHPSSYLVENALCRNIDAGERAYGKGTAFEWVGLVNRQPSEEAVLHLEGLPAETVFASVTDLTTGREHVVPVQSDSTGHTVTCRPCRARRMIRLYIRL